MWITLRGYLSKIEEYPLSELSVFYGGLSWECSSIVRKCWRWMKEIFIIHTIVVDSSEGEEIDVFVLLFLFCSCEQFFSVDILLLFNLIALTLKVFMNDTAVLAPVDLLHRLFKKHTRPAVSRRCENSSIAALSPVFPTGSGIFVLFMLRPLPLNKANVLSLSIRETYDLRA